MLDVTWVAHTLHIQSTTRTLASTLTSHVKEEPIAVLVFVPFDEMLHCQLTSTFEEVRQFRWVGISPSKPQLFGSSALTDSHCQAAPVLPVLPLHGPCGPCVSRGCPVKVHQSGFCGTGGSAKSRVGKIDCAIQCENHSPVVDNS